MEGAQTTSFSQVNYILCIVFPLPWPTMENGNKKTYREILLKQKVVLSCSYYISVREQSTCAKSYQKLQQEKVQTYNFFSLPLEFPAIYLSWVLPFLCLIKHSALQKWSVLWEMEVGNHILLSGLECVSNTLAIVQYIYDLFNDFN